MKFVLLIFKDNLLHLNHVDIFDNSTLKVLMRTFRFLCDVRTVVSSANIVNLKIKDELIISLM